MFQARFLISIKNFCRFKKTSQLPFETTSGRQIYLNYATEANSFLDFFSNYNLGHHLMMKSLLVSTVKTAGISQETNVNSTTI